MKVWKHIMWGEAEKYIIIIIIIIIIIEPYQISLFVVVSRA